MEVPVSSSPAEEHQVAWLYKDILFSGPRVGLHLSPQSFSSQGEVLPRGARSSTRTRGPSTAQGVQSRAQQRLPVTLRVSVLGVTDAAGRVAGGRTERWGLIANFNMYSAKGKQGNSHRQVVSLCHSYFIPAASSSFFWYIWKLKKNTTKKTPKQQKTTHNVRKCLFCIEIILSKLQGFCRPVDIN